MKVVFVGPGAGRIIPAAGVIALRGVPVDVAGDLGKRLLEQDVWALPAPKKEKP